MSNQQINLANRSLEKSTAVAYLFYLFLPMLGAHRLYLGRTASGLVQLILLIIVAPLLAITVFLIPIALVLLCFLFIWYFIDLFLVPGIVREENMKLMMLSARGSASPTVHVTVQNIPSVPLAISSPTGEGQGAISTKDLVEEEMHSAWQGIVSEARSHQVVDKKTLHALPEDFATVSASQQAEIESGDFVSRGVALEFETGQAPAKKNRLGTGLFAIAISIFVVGGLYLTPGSPLPRWVRMSIVGNYDPRIDTLGLDGAEARKDRRQSSDGTPRANIPAVRNAVVASQVAGSIDSPEALSSLPLLLTDSGTDLQEGTKLIEVPKFGTVSATGAYFKPVALLNVSGKTRLLAWTQGWYEEPARLEMLELQLGKQVVSSWSAVLGYPGNATEFDDVGAPISSTEYAIYLGRCTNSVQQVALTCGRKRTCKTVGEERKVGDGYETPCFEWSDWEKSDFVQDLSTMNLRAPVETDSDICPNPDEILRNVRSGECLQIIDAPFR